MSDNHIFTLTRTEDTLNKIMSSVTNEGMSEQSLLTSR